MSASQKKRSYGTIQVLRGVAAGSVVVYHAAIIGAQEPYNIIPSMPKLDYLALGVNLFFILSGFVISLAHSRDVSNRSALLGYVLRRIIRIYPIYWLLLLLYIGAAANNIGSPNFSYSPVNLLQAFLLVDFTGTVSLPLKVAWSMLYEVAFYAVFAIFIISQTAGVVVVAFWFGAALLNAAFFHSDFYILQMWGVYFIAGAVVEKTFRDLSPKTAVACLLLGIAGLGFYASTNSEFAISKIQFGQPLTLMALAVVFSLIVLGITSLEEFFVINAPRWAQYAGEASYSIYLAHSAIISIYCIVLERVAPQLSIDPIMFIGSAVIISLFGGGVIYELAEKPMLAKLRLLVAKDSNLDKAS